MNKILQQVANTIVTNLANTEPTSLFNGKIGVCLFLYKYARYSGNKVYEDIASNMMDDVLEQLALDMSPSIMDGLAGIGYGLIELLREEFIEGDPDEDIFQDMDAVLLRNIKPLLTKEINTSTPLYSSGIYLISRMSFHKESVESAWISEVIECAIDVISNYVKKGQVPKLSLLNSMLYAFGKLIKIIETDKAKIESLLTDILYLSSLSIQQKESFQDVDIVLYKQIILKLPHSLQPDIEHIIEITSVH